MMKAKTAAGCLVLTLAGALLLLWPAKRGGDISACGSASKTLTQQFRTGETVEVVLSKLDLLKQRFSTEGRDAEIDRGNVRSASEPFEIWVRLDDKSGGSWLIKKTDVAIFKFEHDKILTNVSCNVFLTGP